MTLLLRMVTGSHLYGTARPDSDLDIHEIHDRGTAYHESKEGKDYTRWAVTQWMSICDRGGHNALDLMMAPEDWPEVDLIKEFRLSYKANPVACEDSFRHTIRGFAKKALKTDTQKMYLHSWRLADHLEQIFETGRYTYPWKRSSEMPSWAKEIWKEVIDGVSSNSPA
jgi:hypothetical protein